MIIVEGGFLERFINMCSKLNISLWKVDRKGENSFCAFMKLTDAKKIRKVARRTCCKARFQRRKGLPFLIKRLVRHKVFLVGVVVFLFILISLNMFVWQVNINCDQPFDRTKLTTVLSKNGIRSGVLISSIDFEQSKVNIIKECSDISYIYIRRNGMIVDVKVALAKKAPVIFPENVPCNIVAKRAGVITNIYSKIGDKCAQDGDLVSKGQLLISGNLTSLDEKAPPKLVHAFGVVKAETWYDGTKRVLGKKVDENNEVIKAANTLKVEIEKQLDHLSIIKRSELVVFQNKKGQKFVKVTIFCEEDIGVMKGMG